MSKTKKQSSKKYSLKKESLKKKSVKTEKKTELTIKSLIDNKITRLVHITYNKKSYGYFLFGLDMFEYYGERKIKFNSDTNTTNTTNSDYERLYDKKCISIYFHKDKTNNYEYAYLDDFFYSRKNELCLTKKKIKPVDMFPLFDIVMQELKINRFELRDASKLHLKYCNYRLGIFGLLEKNYTYYNKFGFFPIMHMQKKFKPETPTTTETPTTKTPSTTETSPTTETTETSPTTETTEIPKTKKNKPIIENKNKIIKLTPIGKTTRKILKAVTNLQTIKLKEILTMLEHYHYDLSNDYRLHKTKNILFDNLSESIKYRMKDVIIIYNKENPKEHYNYSYTQLLNLSFKEFLLKFILFFCNYKKNNIKYIEEVDYITTTLNHFITLFRRKPINKILKYNKIYYYGKTKDNKNNNNNNNKNNSNKNNSNNTMTGFDMSTKKFIIKQCPKYDISINKNSEKNSIEINISDI